MKGMKTEVLNVPDFMYKDVYSRFTNAFGQGKNGIQEPNMCDSKVDILYS